MDAQLEQRWKSAKSPFDGICLHLNDYIELSRLRLLLIAIVNILRASSDVGDLLRFDDWHEHDGYVTQSAHKNWDTLNRVLTNDDSLYAARHGDEYVRSAFYATDYSFLLRFYFVDDDPGYNGVWGNCDVSGAAALIERIQNAAPESVANNLAVSNAKEYFDRVYAG